MFQSALQMFLQLVLVSLAMAAPVTVDTVGHGNTWQYGAGGGVVGFVVLVLDIIVFIEVLQSDRSVIHKVLWCLAVFLFPVLGLIVYWFFSNRTAHMGSGGYETIA